MASWLKTAEGLLQAVDKTAKAVSTATKQQGARVIPLATQLHA
jgi:hypothetical protein